MNVTFLEKIISNVNVTEDNQPAVDHDPNGESADIIESRGQIQRFLDKVHKQHQLLTVEMEHLDTQFSTLILEINEEEKYLVLDGFYPKLDVKKIPLKSKVKFYTYLSGVELDFISTIEAIAEKNDEPYYKVPIPEKILYFQKRQFLRVPVSLASPIRVVLSDKNSLITNGELRDLSIGGFSARLKLMEQRYSVGEIVPKCMLYMPGDKKILCSVEIRQTELPTTIAPPKVGARFLGLRKNDEKTIERFIAEIDRDLVKRVRS